jgi:hypothetical protein
VVVVAAVAVDGVVRFFAGKKALVNTCVGYGLVNCT